MQTKMQRSVSFWPQEPSHLSLSAPTKNSDAPGCDSDGSLGQGGIRHPREIKPGSPPHCSLQPRWPLRLIGVVVLPRDLLFAEFHRMLIGQRQQGLALANHFHHWTLSYCVLVGDAGIVQQTSGVDGHLLVIGVELRMVSPAAKYTGSLEVGSSDFSSGMGT